MPPGPANAPTSDGPPLTDVIPPPAADPSLLAPPEDPFGQDPADALFSQGYLADSKGTIGAAPTPPPAAPPSPPAAAPLNLPAFAPLGGNLAPDPQAAFRTALDAAFAARAAGTPFVVVALRMDPAAPDAAHFGAVEAGLKASLRPADRMVVDAARRRAAVVLPGVQQEAAQTLFGGLQAHLQASLGPDASRVLQSVAAVTIPNGQPFQNSAGLIAYALEG